MKLPFWLRSIFFILLVGLVFSLLEPILVSTEKPGVFAIEKLIEDQEDFDIVILGSSHAYCSFVPEILDTVLEDTNTINLSSPNLGLPHTAILLRQILKSGKIPEAVILEVFSLGSNMDDLLQISFFNDYSKTWQLDNLVWIAGYYETDELLAPLFPLIHQHESWKQPELLQENISNYMKLKEINSSKIANDLGYLNDGYRGIPVFLTESEFQRALNQTLPFIPSEPNILALEQILTLSEEYGFDVIFVQAPYINGFQTDYSLTRDLSIKYDIPMYLLNETHANRYDRFDYMNTTHLNTHGAIPTSITLAEIISTEFNRTLDQPMVNAFEQLQIENIEIGREGNQIQVTLIPISSNVNWNVQWDFYLWDTNIVASQNSNSLSFSFPSNYLESKVAHLIITIYQEGSDYPLKLRLQPKNFN